MSTPTENDRARAQENDKPDHERALSLSDGHDPSGPWPYERCKSERCRGRRVTCGFQVSDDDWAAVTDDEAAIPHGHVLCLSCFDELAQAKGVRYQLLSVAPVTWTGDTTAARPLPEEGDEEAARAWYAANPPEVQACPTMFAGDAIAIYKAGMAAERARIVEALRAEAKTARNGHHPYVAEGIEILAARVEDGTL